MTNFTSQDISRRTVLKSGAASAGAFAFAPTILRAQGARVRKNRLSPGGLVDLKTYGEGVAEMLKLPLDDPRKLTEVAPLSFSLVVAGSDKAVAASVETNGQLESVTVHALTPG